ncbi:Transposase, partial [Dysosmobacter welbionis]
RQAQIYPCPRVRPSDSLPTGIRRGKGVLRNEIFRTDSLYAARAENPRGLERVASKCLGRGDPASSK